jgi:hypothetical protein
MWCGLGAFPAHARIAAPLARFGVQLHPNPTARLQLLARSAGHNQLWIGHLPASSSRSDARTTGAGAGAVPLPQSPQILVYYG